MAVDWEGRRVLVTGGASFIGSHLVDLLVARGARVRVVDNLSSGDLGHLQHHLLREAVDFVEADLRLPEASAAAVKDQQVVFHLAADHGGRGYVDLHQVACSTNLLLDAQVFQAAAAAGVDKVVFASSGCVYPNFLQADPSQELYLTEEMAGPPYDADHLYGWAKLMAEMTLQAYYKEGRLKSATCRYFTVYGPRAKENHAVIAMIARAFVGQDPVEVWGTGEQIRNWTYVDDIVRGTLLAAERIEDGTTVNLGTMERIRVLDAMRLILELMGRRADIRQRPDMPTGPLNRVADNLRAKQLLGWEPLVLFRDGVEQTIAWYRTAKDPEAVRRILDGGGLIERRVEMAADEISHP